MRKLWLQALYKTGLAGLCRLVCAARGRFVVELHGIPATRGESLPEPLRPSFVRDDLRRLLDWLRTRFRFLEPEEFLAARTPGVLLTFDDGFANLATTALPLLEDYRAPSVFFVTTQHVKSPQDWLAFVRRQIADHEASPQVMPVLHQLFDGMSEDQLRRCASSRWVTIGSHTSTHPMLTACSDEELERELTDSKRWIEGVIGDSVDLLAYPTGDYDARVAKAAQSAGYRAAFVERSRGLGLGALEIPRVGIYDSSEAYLAAKFSGVHQRPLPVRPQDSSR